MRLMGTIWADTDGLHDDLDTPFGLAAWMDAVGIQHSDTLASPEELAEARALRDSIRCLAAHQTDDTRPAAVSRADVAWSVDVAQRRRGAPACRSAANRKQRLPPRNTKPRRCACRSSRRRHRSRRPVRRYRCRQTPRLPSPRLRPLLRQDPPPPRMVLHRLRQPSTCRTPLPPKATGNRETQNELTRARSLPRRNRSFLVNRRRLTLRRSPSRGPDFTKSSAPKAILIEGRV